MKKTKILFVLPNLNIGGGGSTVMSNIISNLNNDKFEIIVVLIEKKTKQFTLPSYVKLNELNSTGLIKASLSLYRLISLIRPNLVFSNSSHVNILMIFFKLLNGKFKLIIRESTIISIFLNLKFSLKNKFIIILIKHFYNFSDKIICQSLDMKDDLVNNLNINVNKIVIIPNIVLKPIIINKEYSDNCIQILSVTRLEKYKGIYRLIDIFEGLQDINFKLLIIGEGSEKKDFIDYIKAKKMEQKITILPFNNSLQKYYNSSDLMVSASFIDGMPNSIIESCAHGCPAIAFDCIGGTKEIIIHGVNGFLIENGNIGAFQNSVRSFYKHRLDRSLVSSETYKKFSAKKIMFELNNLIKNMQLDE